MVGIVFPDARAAAVKRAATVKNRPKKLGFISSPPD
jgi:hypothetical protein